jgi:hypothetical protein
MDKDFSGQLPIHLLWSKQRLHFRKDFSRLHESPKVGARIDGEESIFAGFIEYLASQERKIGACHSIVDARIRVFQRTLHPMPTTTTTNSLIQSIPNHLRMNKVRCDIAQVAADVWILPHPC